MTGIDPRRPRLHLTPERGWINDPYGITYLDGRYLAFCQYDPAGTRWVPGLCWGVAESTDLLHWSPLRVALRPADPSYGCWSGTVVVEGGQPVLLYTRVDATPGRHDIGQVLLAHLDGTEWVSEDEPVLLGPPAGSGVVHFRDPQLTRTPEGWFMAIGAALEPDVAAVLGYRSPDLRNWEYTGLVCSAPAAAGTGSMWECPQLFELAGHWVLVVSVGTATGPSHVLAAVGHFDGSAFEPAAGFHPLLYGDAAYATTTFLDADGRRCALSWLREAAPTTGAWSGALSLPVVLDLAGDRVVARPHPALSTARGPAGDRVRPHVELRWRPDQGLDLGTLALDVDGDELRLTRPGLAEQRMPWGGGAVTLVLDGSVAEVATAAGLAAVRIDPVPDQPLPPEVDAAWPLLPNPVTGQ